MVNYTSPPTWKTSLTLITITMLLVSTLISERPSSPGIICKSTVQFLQRLSFWSQLLGSAMALHIQAMQPVYARMYSKGKMNAFFSSHPKRQLAI